jgi:hypothetical protein
MEGFFADFCANAPFATGTGTFSYNDNDAAFSGNRDDAFRFQLEGDAASASGQRYHVLAKFKAIVSRGGVERVTSDEVQVSPAGG